MAGGPDDVDIASLLAAEEALVAAEARAYRRPRLTNLVRPRSGEAVGTVEDSRAAAALWRLIVEARERREGG